MPPNVVLPPPCVKMMMVMVMVRHTSCDVTCKLGSEPRHERQRAVVDDMERGQMVKLLPEDEENRVEEVNEL